MYNESIKLLFINETIKFGSRSQQGHIIIICIQLTLAKCRCLVKLLFCVWHIFLRLCFNNIAYFAPLLLTQFILHVTANYCNHCKKKYLGTWLQLRSTMPPIHLKNMSDLEGILKNMPSRSRYEGLYLYYLNISNEIILTHMEDNRMIQNVTFKAKIIEIIKL